MLVPMIDVKVDKGKKETSLAEIALVSLTSKITNLITTLDFVQTEPVSDIVKETSYRVYFISDNNEKISNENIVIAIRKIKIRRSECSDSALTLRIKNTINRRNTTWLHMTIRMI